MPSELAILAGLAALLVWSYGLYELGFRIGRSYQRVQEGLDDVQEHCDRVEESTWPLRRCDDAE